MFREGVELFVKWNGGWFIRVGGSRGVGRKLESLISNMVFGVKRYRGRSTQRRGDAEVKKRVCKARMLTLLWVVVWASGCVRPETRSVETQQPTAAVAKSTQRGRESGRGRRARGQALQGLVVGVSDGDTITIRDDHNNSMKVRLQGIDAPEKGQDFSNVSRQHLADLVAGKQVDVEYEKLDQHGRIVGKVMLKDRDVCLEQVKAGLAWHYKYFEKEQTASDREEYAAAENQARAAKVGLWQYESPTPPWEFRHEGGVNRIASGLGEEAASGQIIGNRRSMIYHWPGCPHYNDISLHNRVYFGSREEAEKAGFRASRDCN